MPTRTSNPGVAAGRVVMPPAAEPQNPSDPADREELIWRSVDAAVARYHEARRFAEVARRVDSAEAAPSHPWSVLAAHQASEAEADLIRAIRCLDPGVLESDVPRAERRRWEPRGVKMGGKLYLAVPDFDAEDLAESDSYWLMRLAVVDASAIADLDESGGVR